MATPLEAAVDKGRLMSTDYSAFKSTKGMLEISNPFPAAVKYV